MGTVRSAHIKTKFTVVSVLASIPVLATVRAAYGCGVSCVLSFGALSLEPSDVAKVSMPKSS